MRKGWSYKRRVAQSRYWAYRSLSSLVGYALVSLFWPIILLCLIWQFPFFFLKAAVYLLLFAAFWYGVIWAVSNAYVKMKYKKPKSFSYDAKININDFCVKK